MGICFYIYVRTRPGMPYLPYYYGAVDLIKTRSKFSTAYFLKKFSGSNVLDLRDYQYRWSISIRTQTSKLNNPFACAAGKILNNCHRYFAVTGTLLSPVQTLGYVYVHSSKKIRTEKTCGTKYRSFIETPPARATFFSLF